MTENNGTPPADNPPNDDPDAGLSDEQKAAKGMVKGWVKEAFGEFIAEHNKAEEEPPKRTKQTGGDFLSSLFGGFGS